MLYELTLVTAISTAVAFVLVLALPLAAKICLLAILPRPEDAGAYGKQLGEACRTLLHGDYRRRLRRRDYTVSVSPHHRQSSGSESDS